MERSKELQSALESLPKLYSTDGKKTRKVHLVVFHMFSRWTWYVVEGEQQEDGDWLLFCWCRSGFGEQDDEWGYTLLSQFYELDFIRAYTPADMIIDNEGDIA